MSDVDTSMSIQEIMDMAGLETLNPGQKVVKKFKKPGQYKSHCMVFNWKNPDKLRIEVKAGLTGKDLPPNELKNYPVWLQAPTYIEYDIDYAEDKKAKSNGKAKK